VYVDRVVAAGTEEKRIERRTVRAARPSVTRED